MQATQRGKVLELEAKLSPVAMSTPLILDTHVLLDLWLFNDPRVAPLRRHLHALRWVATAEMVEEWRQVLARGFAGYEARTPSDSPWLAPKPSQVAPWRSRDPSDQKFLDLAHALKPSWLWSRDRALLAHKLRAAKVGVMIATPKDGCVRLLASQL